MGAHGPSATAIDLQCHGQQEHDNPVLKLIVRDGAEPGRAVSSHLARQAFGTYQKDGAERGRSITTTMTAMESGLPRMPMVVGLNLSTAREAISSAITDPQVTVLHSYTDVVPPGMVFVQQPAAGDEVTPGSQIRVTVSTGPTAGRRESSVR